MIDGLPQTLTVIAAIGAGLNAGVYFTFSTFVGRALAQLPASHGVAAMQAINREAPTFWFMTAMFGTAAVCMGTLVIGIVEWGEPWAPYLLVGSLSYFVCIVMTMAYHQPHNLTLDGVDAASPGADAAWRRYLPAWTAWNHVRTMACVASAITFVLALR